MMHSFEIRTDLAAPPETVWSHVTTVDGVNSELMPLMRMTVPRALRNATLNDLPVGRRAGRGWVLLFGLIPVDYDDMTIAERGPGQRFLEQSTMLTQSHWTHERSVEPTPGGSRITDHLTWQGRTRPLGAMYRFAIPILFGHRHRRLAKRFGMVRS
jgi:ligand-binding SRPBCC domain-containing protein